MIFISLTKFYCLNNKEALMVLIQDFFPPTSLKHITATQPNKISSNLICCFKIVVIISSNICRSPFPYFKYIFNFCA